MENTSSNYIEIKNLDYDIDNSVHNECAICFEDLTNTEQDLIVLDCNHKFHFNCITEWYNKPNSDFRCPECNIQKDVKEIIYSKKNLENKKRIENAKAIEKQSKKTCFKETCSIC